MAIVEGTADLPVVGGVTVAGQLSTDGNVYLPRADAQRNQKVALYAANGNPLLTTADPGYVRSIGANTLLADATPAWANSAGANTIVNVDIAIPTPLNATGKLLIWVRNPSAVTALAYTIQVKETITSTDYWADLASGTGSVLANTKAAFVVEGALLGGGLRLVLKNSTLLGGSDGFTANVRARLF